MEPVQSILLVDDEPHLLIPLQAFLEHAKWNVTLVSSAAEALDVLQQRRFRIIVTDYRMPQMSGIEFIRQAKAKSPESAFILITGTLDEAAEMFCREWEVSVLQKPFSSALLLEQIQGRCRCQASD